MKKKVALIAMVLLAGGAAFVALRPSTPPSWSIARHESDLLARGWASTPYASPLISQSNPSACGPTSLMNVWSSLDAGVFESPCRPAGFCSGGGHHSPIGAVVEDRVFVLDVNKSYGPWLVPIEKLFEAMDTVDSSSGKKRGLLRIEL